MLHSDILFIYNVPDEIEEFRIFYSNLFFEDCLCPITSSFYYSKNIVNDYFQQFSSLQTFMQLSNVLTNTDLYYSQMNMRLIHIFFKISKAIRQFVSLFTCFVRVVNLKLFWKFCKSKRKQFHVRKPYKTSE